MLKKLLGGGVINGVKGIAQIISDYKTKKIDAATTLAQLVNEMPKVQAEVTKIEANHPSLFVAGWRPFIGWVCGVGLVYTFVFRPIVNGLIFAVSSMLNKPLAVEVFVAIDVGELMALLTGMLGLAGYRTYEKYKGKARD